MLYTHIHVHIRYSHQIFKYLDPTGTCSHFPSYLFFYFLIRLRLCVLSVIKTDEYFIKDFKFWNPENWYTCPLFWAVNEPLIEIWCNAMYFGKILISIILNSISVLFYNSSALHFALFWAITRKRKLTNMFYYHQYSLLQL